MHELAKITGIRSDIEGTEMKVFVPEKNLFNTILDKRISDVELRLDDGRTITNAQRKKAYATIRDIADYTGYLPEQMKEIMKYEYIIRTGNDYFSLGTCTVDIAREFISMLLEFCLEQGIPLSDLAINRADDIGRYLYYCIKNRVCAICGRKGEIHHVDKIGMGNDRRSIDDSDYRKICLCRTHHTEDHTIGEKAFQEKYKVYGIIVKEQENGLEELQQTQQVQQSQNDS